MFGKRIVELRKRQGLTQAELARSLGISRSALSLYEIEKREPDIETLSKLSSLFKVSVGYILGNEHEVIDYANYTMDTPEFAFNFKMRIHDLMIEQKISEDEFAKRTGFHTEGKDNCLYGNKIPSIENLIKISEELNVSTDYLLGISDKPDITDKRDNDSIPTFAARLKSLLNEDTNFTINDYAEMAHIAITDLENYIEGKSTPSSYEICKLVEIFDTSADYLFGKSKDPHPPKEILHFPEHDNFQYRLSIELDGNYLETELADKLDTSISKIRKMLSGKEMPTPTILEKISGILKKSTDYLLGLTNFSRVADNSGQYPFHMDEESIKRLQKLLGNEWNVHDAEYNANDLGLTYEEYYMMYYYGFIPHISVLQKICKQYDISADYLLNISDSKLCVKISKETNEDDLLNEYRKLEKPYRQKINGLLAEQILQQERDNYMRSSSVAADEKYIDSKGKSLPSSGTEGDTMAV